MAVQSSSVRGELLSCYTASIAAYLAALGLDPYVPFSCQWFIGVRLLDGPSEVEVRHYHTSLLGDGDPFRIEVRAARAFGAAEAHSRIAAEVARSGAAIVQADTELLPWLVTHGKSSAPHWVVIDEVDGDGCLHVLDLFEWQGSAGHQTGHAGWIQPDEMDWFAYQPALERNRRFQVRERLAFGERMVLPAAPAGDAPSWRWFERVDADFKGGSEDTWSSTHAGLALAERLIARSCETLPVAVVDGELTGGTGILALADVIDDTLESGEAYGLANDLWVIGRTRQLFIDRLESSPHGLADTKDVEPIAQGMGIASKWEAVTRLMHYNETVSRLGRAPRRAVVGLLRELAELEDEFLRGLRSSLEGGLDG